MEELNPDNMYAGTINEEIKKHYIKSNHCLICKLQEERIPPSCLIDCNFCIQYEYESENKRIEPKVVTKIDSDSVNNIDISRSLLVMNYYFVIPFIFRCTSENNFVLHHKNGDPFDDSPTNLIILDGSIDSIQLSTHRRMLRVDNKIRRILEKQIHMNSMTSSEKVKLYNYLVEMEKLKKQSMTFEHDKQFQIMMDRRKI